MFKKLVIESFVLLAVLGLLTATTEANAQQLSQLRPRVLISTDIGGTDPDDYWHNCAGARYQYIVREEIMVDWARRWAWLK
jgi:hypothetical protein